MITISRKEPPLVKLCNGKKVVTSGSLKLKGRLGQTWVGILSPKSGSFVRYLIDESGLVKIECIPNSRYSEPESLIRRNIGYGMFSTSSASRTIMSCV
jgi:hypothetical protein